MTIRIKQSTPHPEVLKPKDFVPGQLYAYASSTQPYSPDDLVLGLAPQDHNMANDQPCGVDLFGRSYFFHHEDNYDFIKVKASLEIES